MNNTSQAARTPPTPSKNTQRHARSLKSIVIEPFAQLKLGIYVIAASAVFCILAGFLFYYTFLAQYEHVMDIFQVTNPDTQWELISNDVFYANFLKLTLFFALYIVILFAIIFRTTHKYYGPLISIERFSRAITAGKYFSRVTIRKQDELKNLASQLNAMAQELEKKHGSLVDESGKSVRRRKTDQTSGDAHAEGPHASEHSPRPLGATPAPSTSQ